MKSKNLTNNRNRIIKRLTKWLSLFFNVGFIVFVILKKRINILHPITEGTPPTGIVKILMPRIKLVSSFLTLVPSWHKKGLWYLHSSQVLSLKNSDIIDVLGQSYLQTLEKININYNPKKIHISECSFILPFKIEEKKENIVVFSGRLDQQKNPVLFVEAAKIVLASYTENVRFIILGSGPQKSTIENLINKYQINDNFSLEYSLKQTEILSKSIIFCSLQDKDNYPGQSLLQAMYAGNGIIATNVGETDKLIQHNISGFLTKPDPKKIAEYICYYLKNKEMRKQMGMAASTFVMNHHNIELFSKYLSSLYKKVI